MRGMPRFLLGVDAASAETQGTDQPGLPDLAVIEGHKRERATETRGPGPGARGGLWPQDRYDTSSGGSPHPLFYSLRRILFISRLVGKDKNLASLLILPLGHLMSPQSSGPACSVPTRPLSLSPRQPADVPLTLPQTPDSFPPRG